MTTYIDTYISGPPAEIDAVLAANPDAAAVIAPRVLDGIAHACIRTVEGTEPLMPEASMFALSDFTEYPETARMAVGGFMADPAEDVLDNTLPEESVT